MEKAIKKAIEGGYDKPIYSERFGGYDTLLLDPLFWQALGKAEGWKEKCMDCDGEVTRFSSEGGGYVRPHQMSWCPSRCEGKNFKEGWSYNWHRFIDHLAEGKDINSFFEELLK